MTIQINPPPQPRYPKAIADDREARSYFDAINRIILQLYRKTSGGTESFDDQLTQFNELEDLIYLSFIGKDKLNEVSIGANYNADAGEFIVVTADCTITLPQYPDSQDRVRVYLSDFLEVTIDGNGNNIFDDTSLILRAKYRMLDLIFLTSLGKWVAV